MTRFKKFIPAIIATALLVLVAVGYNSCSSDNGTTVVVQQQTTQASGTQAPTSGGTTVQQGRQQVTAPAPASGLSSVRSIYNNTRTKYNLQPGQYIDPVDYIWNDWDLFFGMNVGGVMILGSVASIGLLLYYANRREAAAATASLHPRKRVKEPSIHFKKLGLLFLQTFGLILLTYALRTAFMFMGMQTSGSMVYVVVFSWVAALSFLALIAAAAYGSEYGLERGKVLLKVWAGVVLILLINDLVALWAGNDFAVHRIFIEIATGNGLSDPVQAAVISVYVPLLLALMVFIWRVVATGNGFWSPAFAALFAWFIGSALVGSVAYGNVGGVAPMVGSVPAYKTAAPVELETVYLYGKRNPTDQAWDDVIAPGKVIDDTTPQMIIRRDWQPQHRVDVWVDPYAVGGLSVTFTPQRVDYIEPMGLLLVAWKGERAVRAGTAPVYIVKNDDVRSRVSDTYDFAIGSAYNLLTHSQEWSDGMDPRRVQEIRKSLQCVVEKWPQTLPGAARPYTQDDLVCGCLLSNAYDIDANGAKRLESWCTR